MTQRTARPALVAAAVAFLSAALAADTGFLDRTVAIGSDSIGFQVYVPRTWTNAQKWPVIVYLHGNGAQGTDGLRHTVSGIADAVRRNSANFPALVVMPQGQPGARWSSGRMQEGVLAAIEQTVREFNGDTDRVYLTGFSMGGQGVLRMAARYPQRFAGLIAIAGGVVPRVARYAPAQIEEDLRLHPFLEPNPYAGTAQRIKVPILVIHGDQDELVPVAESRRVVAALKAAGAKVEYTEYAGVDHSGSAQKALSDPAVWSWLLEHRRSAQLRPTG